MTFDECLEKLKSESAEAKEILEQAEIFEVKIVADCYGNLLAVLPDGRETEILVDVIDFSHYGALRIKMPMQLTDKSLNC